MQIRQHESLDAFLTEAGSLYRADPVGHTLPLTVLAAEQKSPSTPSPILLTVHDQERIVGAYLRTPPYPGQIGAVPEDTAEEVVSALGKYDPELETISGPEERAMTFASRWSENIGGSHEIEMRQRLYGLGYRESTETTQANSDPGALVFPWNVAGEVGEFDEEADAEWMARWRTAFAVDAGDIRVPRTSPAELLAFLRGGRVPVIWTVAGDPVAMAIYTEPLNGMSRIGHVYTPSEHRRCGYGSAVTAEAARRARDAGAQHIVLFADLDNPVSNSIYQRLGFKPVSDTLIIKLNGT